MTQLLEKFNFELLHAFIFLAIEIKKLVLVGKTFLFSLDLPLINNILYKMITILLEKILNAIYLR